MPRQCSGRSARPHTPSAARHWVRAPLRTAALLLLSLAAGTPLVAQTSESTQKEADSPLIESVDVRRVNLDVVVTDRNDIPVAGLNRDQFDLRIGGRSVPITNFAEWKRTPGEEGALPPSAPRVVILIDQRNGELSRRRQLMKDVSSSLERILEASHSVLVATLGSRLEVEQPFTRELTAIESTLVAATEPRPLATGDMSQLLRQIERAAPLSDDEAGNGRAISQARTLLTQIRAQAQQTVFGTTRATVQIGHLVRALAATPQRSVVLFLSGGLESTPAEVAYRMWWNKYRDAASSFGVVSVEAELMRADGSGGIEALINAAANSRVTFYSLSLGRNNRPGSSAEFGSADVISASLQTTGDPLASLLALAEDSGGTSALRANRSGDLIDGMLRDLEIYYSLAFDPSVLGDSGNTQRLRVRVSGDGLKVRSPRRLRPRASDGDLLESLYSALYLDSFENRHDLVVEVKEAAGSNKGRRVVSLFIKAPISRLVLLPEAAVHRGEIEVAVASRGEKGGNSAPVSGRVPIEIPNPELLQWMGRSIGARLQVEVSNERQKLGIAVRDAVGQEISTLTVALGPGR